MSIVKTRNISLSIKAMIPLRKPKPCVRHSRVTTTQAMPVWLASGGAAGKAKQDGNKAE